MSNQNVENTIPVLPVKDLERSIQFYTDTLGFKLDWKGGVICGVARDDHPIMLSQIAKADSPSWVWIGMRNYSIFEEWQAKGVAVYQEAMNHDWAYEMKFLDIDGNVLWVATATRKDIPLDD